MKTIIIDKQSNLPIYQQIIQQVTFAVENNMLKPGDKLPTEKELCLEYDIARGTVRRAYDRLQKDGIITITQGKGTFIRKEEKQLSSLDIIDKYLDQLLSLSFSLDDIALFISDKLKERGKTREDISLCIIDNCPEVLTFLGKSLKSFSFSQKHLLISDIVQNKAPSPNSTDLILALPHNIQTIEKLLPECRTQIIPVSAGLGYSTLKALASLSPKSSIGMLCRSRHFFELIKREITSLDSSLTVNCFIASASKTVPLKNFIQSKVLLLAEPSSLESFSLEEQAVLKDFQENSGKVVPLEYVMDQGSMIYTEELVHKLHYTNHRMIY